MHQPRIGRTFLALAALATAFAGAQAQLIDSVDELMVAFRNGGEYQIVPRTYEVTEPLVAGGDVSIVGAGRDSVLIELSGGPVAILVGDEASLHLEGMRVVWAGEGPSDLIVVRGGTLALLSVDLGFAEPGMADEPDPSRPGGHGSALVLQGSATAEVEDVMFARNGGNTIDVLDDSFLRLITPQVIDGLRGLVASGRARVEVGGGVFIDQLAQGVVLIGESQADFVQTVFAGNGHLDQASGQYIDAIVVGESASASFSGGLLRGSPATGLGVSGEASVVVSGMDFEANGAYLEDVARSWQAVFVTGTAQVAVSSGSVTGSPGGAFEVQQQGVLVLEDVEVRGNGGFGHTTVRDQGRLGVQGGIFSGNAGAIVGRGEARIGLYDVELRDGAQHGLVLVEAASADVEGGLIAGHADRGVWVDHGASIDVRSLRIEQNMMGMVLLGEATAFVSDTQVTSNGNTGVLAAGAARVVIDTSSISQNASNGVAVLESAQALVRDSELASNTTNGVLVGGEAAITLERNGISGSAAGVRLESRGVAQGTENTFTAVGVDVDDAR